MLQTSAKLPACPPACANDERWQLVQRICESKHLARSSKLRDFLLYVAERSLTGYSEQVTEVEIARRVFGRGDDFVPTEDSIVRGSARQLRIKIKDYFDEGGGTEPWRMEIPKGAYLPVFTRLHAEVVAAAAVPATPRRIPWLAISLCANSILLIVCGWLWIYKASPHQPENAVTEMLTFSPGAISLVYSDFSLVAIHNLAPNGSDRLSIDNYARWDYSSLEPPASSDPAILRMFDLFRTHRITRTSDLGLTARIVRLDPSSRRIFPRDARDAAARDFSSGSHILLGNPNSTPWTELFEPRLGLRWVQGKGYRDESEATQGGRREYFVSKSTYNETGPGYARIALVPNLADENQVLIIGGVNMVTMEAAGNFALDPRHWEEIRQRLNVPPRQPMPYFEALLETKAVDNTPQTGRLVLARRLHH